MSSHPGCRHRPDTPDTINRRSPAPKIGVVMGDKPAGIVILARSISARNSQVIKQVKKRIVALGKISHLGRPVVHFYININGVLTPPGRDHIFVPNSLKISGLSARAAGSKQQIAPKLCVELCKMGVIQSPLAFLNGFQALVCRQFHCNLRSNIRVTAVFLRLSSCSFRLIPFKVKHHTVHIAGMVGFMVRQKGRIILFGSSIQLWAPTSTGLYADIQKIDIAGRGCEQERDTVSIFYL